MNVSRGPHTCKGQLPLDTIKLHKDGTSVSGDNKSNLRDVAGVAIVYWFSVALN